MLKKYIYDCGISENKEKILKLPLGERGHIQRHENQTDNTMEQYLKSSKRKVTFKVEFIAKL